MANMLMLALRTEAGFPRADRMRCRRVQRDVRPLSYQQPRPIRGGGEPIMLQSHIVDIDGRFVGAAIRLTEGYRFVAVDVRLDELDGSIWPTLAEVKRNARLAFTLAPRALQPEN
jgi:hypothetical protein